jgi:hypothetical protein
MVDGRPDQAATGVLLDLPHELAGELFEVESVRIFWRNDKAKLSLFAVDDGPKFIGGKPFVRSIKPPRRAIPFDAVPLQNRRDAASPSWSRGRSTARNGP